MALHGGRIGGGCGGVINVDVSGGPPSAAATPASIITPGENRAGLPAAPAPSAGHDSSP